MNSSWSSPAVLRTGRRTGRVSSWDHTGRNADTWTLAPGETRVLADLRGPGQITHIWFAQPTHFREVLLRITWDDARQPSVLCPVGDFFCLGNGFTNSYQSALFTASTGGNHRMCYDPATGETSKVNTALNCYAPMPFRSRAVIELINESDEPHQKWFYIDYETFTDGWDEDLGYLHAEFRRANPFGGWGPDLAVNTPMVDAPNVERFAWDNNYVIADVRGRGQYIGCNLSVANLCGDWWGEGDDMIWVDGYKWPPDLHGTGSEDYLGHAWGMQPNAYFRNGSSLHESLTGGYQTSYVFHLENPVYFERELKVTIEAGHANHLANDISSVAYWYAAKPTAVLAPPPVRQRRPVFRLPNGTWLLDPSAQCPGPQVALSQDILDAAPAVADALRPLPAATWRISKLPRDLVLAEVERALAMADPLEICAGVGEAAGHLRIGRSGDRLALSARVTDPSPSRCEPDFWQGSSVEIYGAADELNVPGQVVLLPRAGRQAAEARVYQRAIRQDEAPAIAWRMRRVHGGYTLSALVPLTCLNVDPAAKGFRFEFVVNIPGLGDDPMRRVGLLSMVSDGWRSARRFGWVETGQ